MRKIIFSDVDGTLLNSNHKITKLTEEAIKNIIYEKNYPFVIVSARSPSGIYPILNKYNFNCYIVSYSGGLILDDKKNVLQTRTYDVTVTYDFYYCVPRMWLMGYSEEGVPLNDSEMKQDIMMEYRNQTVTIDPHPCTGVRNISVHPCRHSLLLKKMIENFEKSGKKLDIEMSILIFLKFLHSVVPTIQYDFTMDINF